MKKVIVITLLMIPMIIANCSAGNPDGKGKNTTGTDPVIKLTTETFKKKVFNYEVNKVWKYEGNIPAIIDFYADWCAPCRQLSPIVEEIAKEYAGKIVVYKINTDEEKSLTTNMGISSLPTLVFIPANGKPQYTVGVIPKSTLVKAVNDILLTK
jgi:thioredoxin 1